MNKMPVNFVKVPLECRLHHRYYGNVKYTMIALYFACLKQHGILEMCGFTYIMISTIINLIGSAENSESIYKNLAKFTRHVYLHPHV